jgi:hypothetical protein
VLFNSSSFTCFGQNDHLQKDIINTYGNYYYNVLDINILLTNTKMYIDLIKYTNCNNFRCFNKSMYILVSVKRYNNYIYDIVIVVSIYFDNVLLKMVVLNETCKG